MERTIELDFDSDEKIEARRKEIQLVINDFQVCETGIIEEDGGNITAYRTAFKKYLDKFNETQEVPRVFSIKKDTLHPDRYKVKRKK